jgi:hypothetical protein
VRSKATIGKESLFGTCIRDACARALRTRYAGRPFFVFDLNSGSGTNIIAVGERICTLRSSAVIAWDAVKEVLGYGVVILVDTHRERLFAAGHQLQANGHLFGQHGMRRIMECANNTDVAASLQSYMADVSSPVSAVRGIVIADPNGMQVPTPQLGISLRSLPRVDVLIHLCGLSQQAAYARRNPGGHYTRYRSGTAATFGQVFQDIAKAHWLIGKIASPGRSHHVLFGSNESLRPVLYPGRPTMHHVRSAEGQSLVREIDEGRV